LGALAAVAVLGAAAWLGRAPMRITLVNTTLRIDDPWTRAAAFALAGGALIALAAALPARRGMRGGNTCESVNIPVQGWPARATGKRFALAETASQSASIGTGDAPKNIDAIRHPTVRHTRRRQIKTRAFTRKTRVSVAFWTSASAERRLQRIQQDLLFLGRLPQLR
jgi:hypothetical protein